MTMDRETHKYLLRKQMDGMLVGERRPSSSGCGGATGTEYETPVQVKEKCSHCDFYSMSAEFAEN